MQQLYINLSVFFIGIYNNTPDDKKEVIMGCFLKISTSKYAFLKLYKYLVASEQIVKIENLLQKDKDVLVKKVKSCCDLASNKGIANAARIIYTINFVNSSI